MFASMRFLLPFYVLAFLCGSLAVQAQSGNSGSITGTVLDPSGAVVPDAKVQISNPVSKYQRDTQTDAAGKFTFTNVPFNPYHMAITLEGFAPYVADVDVRSVV